MKKRKFTCKQMKILGIVAILSPLLVNMLIIKASYGTLIRTTLITAIVVFITMYFDCKKEKNKKNS